MSVSAFLLISVLRSILFLKCSCQCYPTSLGLSFSPPLFLTLSLSFFPLFTSVVPLLRGLLFHSFWTCEIRVFTNEQVNKMIMLSKEKLECKRGCWCFWCCWCWQTVAVTCNCVHWSTLIRIIQIICRVCRFCQEWMSPKLGHWRVATNKYFAHSFEWFFFQSTKDNTWVFHCWYFKAND